MSLSDSDYSDCESDDDVPIRFTHGNTKDANLLLEDALAKLKQWKAKYSKSVKEKNKVENELKEAKQRIKSLAEVKLENDKLKVDCDVEKRTFEMKLSNEMEQTKKYQALLKQAKVSLDEMTEKHKEIADLNKANEAKLFQSKIEYAGILSGAAGLEEQVTSLKDEVRSSKQMVNEQLATIQGLSSEKSMLQKDNQILNERCNEMTLQCKELQGLCEKFDRKYAALTQDHLTLKNNSEAQSGILNKSMTESRDEILGLTKERDSLTLNLSHTRENLNSTAQRLSELENLYNKEKLTAEENHVLLKQAEISLQHLKELYSEKEGQLTKQVSNLEAQIRDMKQELGSTRALLKEAQAQRGGQTINSDKTDEIAALNTELGQLSATSEHLREKIKQLEEEKSRETDRFEKINEEKAALIASKSDIEIEMSKQRDAFKDEIRTMKNDMKNNENKHEVLKKKLEGSREELGRMEHELRTLQNSVTEKTNYNEKLNEEIGSLKTDNNVLSHQLNELKASCQERLCEIENLKTRITVIQEDNKNLRGKAEDSLAKVKEKEASFKEVQDKLYDANQKLHVEQIKFIEDTGLLKEEFQERIYSLESEIKQAKYERDSKETQIAALREQINKKNSEKINQDFNPSPVSTGIPEEAAIQYRELFEKYSSVQTENQQLRSEKIILDNNSTQLKISLETEREKLQATEQAVKTTTDMLNDAKMKLNNVQNQHTKANNDIARLEELLKSEKERYVRLTHDYDTERCNTTQINQSMGAVKEQLTKCKDEIKQLTTEKQSLEQALAEKERMLSSEAKLRLHISSQLSSNNTYETALENERRKVEKLEDKCTVLSDQIEKMKGTLEDVEASRKKLREELEEHNKPAPNVSQFEDKIRALKAKLSVEKENAKKVQEVLTKKVKEAQAAAKEELSQRKEQTDKYIAVKSEVGELQGKVTVLLSENERLKSHCDSILKEKTALADDKSELQSRIATDYILRSEVEITRKNLEAKNRVEMNRKLHEMNQKLDYDNKSRETIDKFKAATETKFREDLEKSNKILKEKVAECQDTIERQERQVTSLQLESEKLKQILAEERRSIEKLLPSFTSCADQGVPPLQLPASPRSPLGKICDNANTSYRSAHDANTTWQLMKCKLNESLNKYLVEEPAVPVTLVTPGRVTPGRVTPGRVTPGRLTPGGPGNGGRSTPVNQGSLLSQLHLEPDPVRTSADSFL